MVKIEYKEISKATERNWKKLKPKDDDKLISRANKTKSNRIIIPTEYLEKDERINELLDFIENNRNKYSKREIVFSFALKLLSQKKMIFLSSEFKINSPNSILLEILKCFPTPIIKEIVSFDFSIEYPDILGFIYQVLLLEGEKNKAGAYYTPKRIVENLLSGINLTEDKFLLDPACGTGNFLINVNTDYPENLYGFDIDEIAIFITKINLIIKHSNKEFYPQVFLKDFFDDGIEQENNFPKFDFIVTNPPWGNKQIIKNEIISKTIKSGESFSFFLYMSVLKTKIDGEIRFLLPISFLNVSIHKDIREFILKNCGIFEISLIGRQFSSVLTPAFIIKMANQKKDGVILVRTMENNEFTIVQNQFLKNKDFTFDLINGENAQVITKIYKKNHSTLSNSVWGLGIVTGDNGKHILKHEIPGSEKIYTGKEIKKYILVYSPKYIIFDKSKFQQVADESIYRSKEKLIYKFISNKPCFAYDGEQKLFLNSANILIPKIPGVSIKSVMAILNSKVIEFVYRQKFGQIKVLKRNLMQLPIPSLTKAQDSELTFLVDSLIEKQIEDDSKIQDLVFKIFELNQDEIKIIKRETNG